MNEPIRFAPPYQLPTYDFQPPADLGDGPRRRYPIVIVGAGPAGLTLACDLAQRGVASVLIDEDDTVGVRGASSRGICYAQKSLEILERMEVGDRAVAKGVAWSLGRTLSGDHEVYNFNLQAHSVSEQPPFVNLQQFYLEWFLVDRIQALGLTDLRWKSRVTGVEERDDCVVVQVETPAGSYALEARYLVDGTGVNSVIRTQLGVQTHASRSADRWCITDVRFAKPLPVERWTWVDAPFNEGRAVWQHLMPDDVWRIDYQMPEDADIETISKPEVAGARLRAQLGADVEFEFVWIGPYQYRDHLLDDFRHHRIFFVGDAAHVVSPFGARGGNTGMQDAANLGWKLALVAGGQAPETLLDSYSAERQPACAENLEVTSRSARFLAPATPAEHTLRRAALNLAREHAFARPLINTGRMSVANDYPVSAWLRQGARSVQNVPLVHADGTPTSVMKLLRAGTRCLGLWLHPDPDLAAQAAERLRGLPIDLYAIGDGCALPGLRDEAGVLARHLGAPPSGAAGSFFLVRPDAYLAASVSNATPDAIHSALQTTLGLVNESIGAPA
ncbi:MAG: FAD-dependent monooxygenase [Proteobacteria bacterium]|nr:FAD-dependent monooxygenase [Pseudomonadota bacterium]